MRDVACCAVGINLVAFTLFRDVSSIAWPNLLLLAVVILVAIALHELAHAAAAWLANGKLFEIRYGSGRTVAQWRLGTLVLTLGRVPGVGFCAAAFPTRHHILRRTVVLLMAGMAANLLTLLLALPGFDARRLQDPMALRETILLGSLVALVSSLWPIETAVSGVPQSSDGLELIRIFLGMKRPDLLHAAYYALEAAYALRRQDSAAALTWCRQGLAEYPDNSLLQSNLAVALIESQRYSEALTTLEGLAHGNNSHTAAEFGRSLAQQGFHHALLLNNLAAVMVLFCTDPPALRKAFALADFAVQAFPGQPAFRSTLGSVLVEQGNLEAGIEHLTWAYRHDPDPRGQAYSLAYLAIAFHRQGNVRMASDFLGKALASGVSSHAVQRAQSVLSADEVEKPTAVAGEERIGTAHVAEAIQSRPWRQG